MPCIFLSSKPSVLQTISFFWKKKHAKHDYNNIIKIFIKKATGVHKTITCDVYEQPEGYLPAWRMMFFMNFWIQLLLATNESWIAGSTFPKSNMAFAFARIIFRETWSMRDLRSWIRFRSFSSISIITSFRPHPSSLSFIGALAIISSILLIHSLFLSAPNLEAAKFMKCSWANLTTSLFETLHTTLLSYLWGTKVLKSFLRPLLTNV